MSESHGKSNPCELVVAPRRRTKANNEASFQSITQKGEQTSTSTTAAPHIGHANIAAAEVSGVLAIQSHSKKYSKRNRAKKVSKYQEKDKCHQLECPHDIEYTMLNNIPEVKCDF